MKHYATRYNQAQGGEWRELKAQTLTAAKSEATRRLGRDGYQDDEIRVGIEEFPGVEDSPFLVVASRGRDSRWVNWGSK